MGYLVFKIEQEAIEAESIISANMINQSEKERQSEEGLLSIGTDGQVRADSTITTKWADVIELADGRFAIVAPDNEELFEGKAFVVVALGQDDFPQPENPFDL
jgi:hypothetical protein